MTLNHERMRLRTRTVSAEYVCRVETQVNILGRQTDILIVGASKFGTGYIVRIGLAHVGLSVALPRAWSTWGRLRSSGLIGAWFGLILTANLLACRCLAAVRREVGAGDYISNDVTIIVHNKLRLLRLLTACGRVRRSCEGIGRVASRHTRYGISRIKSAALPHGVKQCGQCRGIVV